LCPGGESQGEEKQEGGKKEFHEEKGFGSQVTKMRPEAVAVAQIL
jgi:hypothetical protein